MRLGADGDPRGRASCRELLVCRQPLHDMKSVKLHTSKSMNGAEK